MSKLTGMQIFELMTDMRDSLILESIPPAWLIPGGKAAVVGAVPVKGSPSKHGGKSPARKKAILLPLWLTKGGWIAALAALLAATGLAVGLFALSDGRGDSPDGSEGETVTEAFTDLEGATAADFLLSQLVLPAEGGHMKLTMNTDIHTSGEINGISSGFRETYTGSLTLAGRQFDVIRKPHGGEQERFVYNGEMLYVITPEKNTKSPFTDEDVLTLTTLLREDLSLPAEQPVLTADALFETVEVKPADKGTGILVVCQGIRTQAIGDLIPLVRPTLEFFGLVAAFDYDEEWEKLTVNYAEEDQQTRELLALAKGKALTVTLEATDDGVLTGITVEAHLVDTEYVDQVGDVTSEIQITSKLAVKLGKQNITYNGGNRFEEKHWRLVFNHPNAEAMGLIPDADGVYHVTTTDSLKWTNQIRYALSHREEFEGKTFHFKVYFWGSMGFVNEWLGNQYIVTLPMGAKDPAPHIPVHMTVEQYEANKEKLRSPEIFPCEIYVTIDLDYISTDKEIGPIWRLERIEFP